MTLKAGTAKTGSSVPLQLDAHSGTDSFKLQFTEGAGNYFNSNFSSQK